jgi:hypothetical protein
MKEKKKIEKILCPTCGVSTNQEVVWNSKELGWNDEESGIWESTSFDLLQCLGCETPTLRKKYLFSEDLNMARIDGKDVIIPEVTLWPKTSYRMLKLKYMLEAPPSVKRIYRETIEAYNNELQTLCAAGVRAIIETVCKDKGIIKEDLKEKIDELRNKGLINSDLAEALHENRLLGNDALHESILFGDTELKTSIELIEAFIDIIYETKNKAKLLKILRESKKG